MKFSIGDKIVLNRTGEEGHVVAFINKSMVEVEVGGVVFPVHTEDIDHPYLRWFTDKEAKKKKSVSPEPPPTEKITERPQRLSQGIYLSFMPVFKMEGMDEIADMLKVYLVNETNRAVKFSYNVVVVQKSIFRHDGELHAFGNLYLHNMPYQDMNDQPRFQWRLEDAGDNRLAAEGVLRIKPARLFAQVSEIQVGGAPSFTYMLADELKLPVKAEPFIAPPAPAAREPVTVKNIEPPKYELDLHNIEALTDTTKGLSNGEIVQLQLDTLRHYLQLAIVHRQERMIVIHGLGKGRLREEVHTILKQMPEVGRFKNEWSARYGFGATEILFRY